MMQARTTIEQIIDENIELKAENSKLERHIDALYGFIKIITIVLFLYWIGPMTHIIPDVIPNSFPCLPDTEDRFFMGRGTQGQCLYMDMDSREVYER